MPNPFCLENRSCQRWSANARRTRISARSFVYAGVPALCTGIEMAFVQFVGQPRRIVLAGLHCGHKHSLHFGSWIDTVRSKASGCSTGLVLIAGEWGLMATSRQQLVTHRPRSKDPAFIINLALVVTPFCFIRPMVSDRLFGARWVMSLAPQTRTIPLG
jgi:hypothetical protein